MDDFPGLPTFNKSATTAYLI